MSLRPDGRELKPPSSIHDPFFLILYFSISFCNNSKKGADDGLVQAADILDIHHVSVAP